MKFYFCEKCGKRIFEKDIEEGRGRDKKLKGVYCQDCSEGVMTMETLPLSDEEARELTKSQPSSGTRSGRRTPGSETGSRRSSSASATARGRRSHTERSAPQEGPSTGNKTTYALVGGGVLAVAVFGLVYFGGGGKPVEKKKARGKKTEKAKKESGPAATGRGNDNPENNAAKRQLPARSEAETVVAKGDSSTPTPPNQQAPEDVPARKTGAARAGEDPREFAKQIFADGAKPSREQLKRLSELPPADEPETIVYDHSFDRGKDDWRSDWGSKVSLTSVAGEKGFRVENGKRRHACYRNLNFTANRTRVRLRMYQQGIEKTQLSTQTRKGILRFNISFPTPPEGQWTDVEVELSHAKSGDVRFENLPHKHLEVQGWPTKGQGEFFAISRVTIINGSTPPKPVKKVQLQTAKRPETVRDREAETRAAYAAFEDELQAILRKREATAALERIEGARKVPALKGRQDDLAIEKAAVGWFSRLDSIARGAVLKLKDVDRFLLKFKQGRPIEVGKRAEYQVQGVQGDKIMVGNKGLALPMPLDGLQRDTLDKLALLGLKKDGPSLVLRAWLQLTTTDLAGKTNAAKSVRATIDRAKAAGAPETDVKLLMRKLAVAERGARERAAAEAWNEALAREKEGEWKLLLAGLKVFNTGYAGTRFLKEKAAEVEALVTKAEDEVGKIEGYHYDFDTKDGLQRFLKRFSVVQTKSMELVQENGCAVFRYKHDPKVNPKDRDRAMQVRSKALRLGENWDIEYRVNLGVTLEHVKKSAERRAALNLCFVRPNEGPRAGFHGHDRFHLDTLDEFDGFFVYGLRGDGQYNNMAAGTKTFKGVANRGAGGPHQMRGGKLRPPASTDAWYDARIQKRGKRLIVTVNGYEVVNAELPDKITSYLATSPITFNAVTWREPKEIRLDSFSYRAR